MAGRTEDYPRFRKKKGSERQARSLERAREVAEETQRNETRGGQGSQRTTSPMSSQGSPLGAGLGCSTSIAGPCHRQGERECQEPELCRPGERSGGLSVDRAETRGEMTEEEERTLMAPLRSAFDVKRMIEELKDKTEELDTTLQRVQEGLVVSDAEQGISQRWYYCQMEENRRLWKEAEELTRKQTTALSKMYQWKLECKEYNQKREQMQKREEGTSKKTGINGEHPGKNVHVG